MTTFTSQAQHLESSCISWTSQSRRDLIVQADRLAGRILRLDHASPERQALTRRFVEMDTQIQDLTTRLAG